MTNEAIQPAEIETHSANRSGISRYTIILTSILALHATFLSLFFEPASAGIDTHGYTVQAKMIAEHGRVWFPLQSPLQFTGPHLLPIQNELQGDIVISRYPPGLPVITSVIYTLFGVNGVFLFNPLLATFTLLGLYGLCRFWMSELCALCAVMIMAVNPVANSWVYMADSHFLVAFCLVWGLYCLARWSHSFSIGYACFAGLLLGWIPAIRYAEVIYAPAIAVFMLTYFQNTMRYWVSLFTAAAAALLPLILLAVHNQIVFGSISLNGYTLEEDMVLFALPYMVTKWIPYLINLHWNGLGWFATLGFIGFFTLCRYQNTRREGILLAGITLSTLMLYISYFFFDHTQRFLFPTFYLYVTAGVWCFHLLMQHQFNGAQSALLILTAISAIWSGAVSAIHVTRIHHQNHILADAAETINSTITNPESIVIMPSSLGKHLIFAGNYKIADEDMFFPEKHPAFSQSESPFLQNPPMHTLDSTHRKRMERYKTTGYELPPVLLRDLDNWSMNNKTIYWVGIKTDIVSKIPADDKVEEVGTVEMDMSIGGPPPMPPRREDLRRIRDGNVTLLQTGGPTGNMGPPDAIAGHGGLRLGGMPPPRLVTLSIMKWTRK